MKVLTTVFTFFFFTVYSFSQPQWVAQNSGVSNFLFDIHFSDAMHGWAAGNTGLVLHTSDGGASWTQLDPPPNNTYYSLSFTDALTGWVSGYDGKIIHTSDGGQTWTDQNSGLNTFIYDIFFINENTGWAVGGDNGTFPSLIKHREIIHTANGGQTWIPQLSETDESLLQSVHFIDESFGAAVGESGIILFTGDGGQTWEEKMSDNAYHFFAIFLTDEQHAYVVGEYLGLPHAAVIFRTENGGDTWSSQSFGEDESLSDIHFTDAMHGWAVGGTVNSATILYTEDGGSSWEYVDAGTDRFLSAVHFVDNNNGWAAGYQGVIVSTTISTGFDEEPNAPGMRVFPNPASNVLYVDFRTMDAQATSIRMINSTGQIVFQLDDLPLSSRNLSINTGALPAGIYTMVAEKRNGIVTQKVLISN